MGRFQLKQVLLNLMSVKDYSKGKYNLKSSNRFSFGKNHDKKINKISVISTVINMTNKIIVPVHGGITADVLSTNGCMRSQGAVDAKRRTYRRTFVLQVLGNKAGAVPCECLQIFYSRICYQHIRAGQLPIFHDTI